MYCPRCHTENEQRARFCLECGRSFASCCASCGAEVPARAKFCPNCGVLLAGEQAAGSGQPPQISATSNQTTPPLESGGERAERRQLTVLFCDLAGSTELARTLDPEDFSEVLQAYQAVSEVVVKRFDGHIAQVLGDGLLVYFGYPKAHEDDAQRAVRAGLGILEAIRSLNPKLQRDHNVRLVAKIGIHTGLVVAGEIVGGERLALGETPNLAARLKDVVDSEALVISEATQRLVTGYFDIRDLGPRDLKGIGQVTAVYQVLHERAARSRLEVAGPAGLTPLVGRDVEVRMLRDRWDNVKSDGQGHVVLLCGEPGIGKSRLVRELEEYVAKDPNSDALLVVLTPQDMTDPTATAEQLKKSIASVGKPVLTSWTDGAVILLDGTATAHAGCREEE